MNTSINKNTDSSEIAIYHEIAKLLGISAEKQGMIDTPDRYYEEHRDNFEERFIESDETDTIRWIGLLDEMIAQGRIFEFDFSAEKEDFLYGLRQILPASLSVEESRLQENDDISIWSKQINDSWQPTGYTLIGFDIDSDSYVTYVCTLDVFHKLAEKAKQIGHRVALLQEM